MNWLRYLKPTPWKLIIAILLFFPVFLFFYDGCYGFHALFPMQYYKCCKEMEKNENLTKCCEEIERGENPKLLNYCLSWHDFMSDLIQCCGKNLERICEEVKKEEIIRSFDCLMVSISPVYLFLAYLVSCLFFGFKKSA